MLAIDLDGTLLGQDRRPTPSGLEAVRRASEAGVLVVLASGRIEPSLRPFASMLGLDGPFICANGAHVLGIHRAEIAFQNVPINVLKAVMEFAAAHDAHLNAYTRSELLFVRETEWSKIYRSRVKSIDARVTSPSEILESEIAKIMLVGDPELIPTYRREIEPTLDASEVRITESEPEYLEFLAPNAHKGHGLKLLAESLGIDRDETAAIGDYLNDVEMLRWAGFSAAVGNAAQGAKEAADVVVADHEEGGVAEFIDRYVLSGRQ